MANYEEYIHNELTGEVALIKSNDYITFQSKKQKKLDTWEKKNSKIVSQQESEELTKQVQQEISAYEGILNATLHIDDTIDWDKLKSTDPFQKYKAKPKPQWADYADKLPNRIFLFELLPFVKNQNDEKESMVKNEYEADLKKHVENEKMQKEKYERDKTAYEKKQAQFNAELKAKRKAYESSEKQGLIDYFSLVLERSEYPESLNLNHELHAEPNGKLLLVEIDLPTPKDVPKVTEYKYVTSKHEIVPKPMKKKEFEEFYNNILYQIILRTVHEVIESDYKPSVDVVVVNGWVNGTDTKTGKPFRNCVLSVQVSRSEFEEINLSQIEPKDCFRHLKGVSVGSLLQLAPVKPIMVINTEDKRIVKASDVLEGMSGDTNLALMDWQDFEVLVRDLISKEFAHEGCKVEVTRASRDAGVDAIAFDEDPIRGGKYVIQAKRYNNLVPLTAVRDLFGTVHNEGAVKGILITTSYYGKDALEFVKNKPLKLINGEELLFMFNKHGYDFTIELKSKKAASSKSY